MKVHSLQYVDDGRNQPFGQRERRIVLWVATNLQHAFAKLRERDGQIGRCRALADAALAVDCEYLGGTDLQIRLHLNLDAAFPVAACRDTPDYCHAAASKPTPSRRSSSSSPTRLQCLPHRLAGRPVVSFVCFDQAVGDLHRRCGVKRLPAVRASSGSRTNVSESFSYTHGCTSPVVADQPRRVGDVRFDFTNTFITVCQKGLIPFRIKRPASGFPARPVQRWYGSFRRRAFGHQYKPPPHAHPEPGEPLG